MVEQQTHQGSRPSGVDGFVKMSFVVEVLWFGCLYVSVNASKSQLLQLVSQLIGHRGTCGSKRDFTHHGSKYISAR